MSQYAEVTDYAKMGINQRALKDFTQDQLRGAIVAASSEADGYMQDVVGIPLVAPYPEAVSLHVLRIAIFNLFNVRGFNRDGDDKIIEDNYDRAIRFFTAVSKGTIKLGPGMTPPIDDAEKANEGPMVYSDPSRGYPDDGYV